MTVEGKTILVTGSTDGVGRWVAERLAADGARVLIQGRDRTRGEAVVANIAKAGGAATFLQADLASLAQVRGLAEAVRRETDGLDVLVNNAGIGTAGNAREVSADGYELRFAVNYLAGFLLARLLLPQIEKRAPARIVNVASAGQQTIDFSDVMLTGTSTAAAHCHRRAHRDPLRPSDLAEELNGHRRHGQRAASGDLHGHNSGAPQAERNRSAASRKAAKQFFSSSPRPRSIGGPTIYFNGKREAQADAQAYDAAARKRLRALSFELVGMADPRPPG